MKFNPVPKVTKQRYKPKKSKRGEFSKQDKQKINERDNGLCRVCYKPAEQIHHVKFKSQNGRGVYTNGLSVCQVCHFDIHQSSKKTKQWQYYFAEMYGPDYYKDEWD